MPATTAKLTQCPACGARITRPELSLCSYCATPLSIRSKPEGASPATLQRLAKMREHKDWAEASTWEPSDAEDAPGAVRSRSLGRWLAGAGALLSAWGLLSGLLASPAHLAFLDVRTLGGVVLLVLGLRLLVRARNILAQLRRQPLESRPAIVIDRRSETDPAGMSAETIYYFSLQFADGSAGEFSFQGRGSNYEVPTSGTTGLACTRGARLLEFLRLRV